MAYSFPDIGPFQTDVDTLTYRAFADLRGTAAGWNIDSQVGVMYASMTEKYFGLIYPALAQGRPQFWCVYFGSEHQQSNLFAPETSAHPSSTLGVIDLNGTHELFQMPGGPATVAVGGSTFAKP